MNNNNLTTFMMFKGIDGTEYVRDIALLKGLTQHKTYVEGSYGVYDTVNYILIGDEKIRISQDVYESFVKRLYIVNMEE